MSLGAMSSKPLTMPARATPDELKNGLSPKRLAELKALARRLRTRSGVERFALRDNPDATIKAVVEATAEEYRRSPETLRRAFADLARAAAWESRTVEDYLLGRETVRGASTGGPALTERMAARVSADTKKALDKALDKYAEQAGTDTGTMDGFLAGAAGYYIKHGRF